MHKNILLFLLLFFMTTPAYAAQWQRLSYHLSTTRFDSVHVHEFNPDTVVSSSEKSIFFTQDGSKWQTVISLRDKDNIIHCVRLSPRDASKVFVGTSKGLFVVPLNQPTVRHRKILGDKTINCLSLNPFTPHELLLGTNNGMYKSQDGGMTWGLLSLSPLPHRPILAITYHPLKQDTVFVATDRALYKINPTGTNCEKVLSFAHYSNQENAESLVHTIPRPVVAFSLADEKLFVSDNHALYWTADLGAEWHTLAYRGSRHNAIRDIEVSIDGESLFLSTDNAILQYMLGTDEWRSVSDELPAPYINSIALHQYKEDVLFAATNRGLFFAPLSQAVPEQQQFYDIIVSPEQLEQLRISFDCEPTIIDVQNAAIAYADVDNSIIRRWHRNARLRAFMPSFAVDVDRVLKNNIELDRGSSSTPDLFIKGPDERSAAWDIALEWDLGDLIWNADQTAIDYRKKYMVELRQDILNEVTRLYFERRKLQLRLSQTQPDASHEYLDLCLKIDELQALIDALTGGYFTKRVDKNA